MAKHHPFRFGTSLQATSRSELIEQVRKIEDLGYSTVIITDHLSQPRLAPIATMAAVATLSSSIWIGSHVFGNDFRHPAILAGEAATIDLISEGRLELGLGTGWGGTDYEQSGISYDAPGHRVSRLIEAIQILKGLFSDEPVTFSGKYYQIKGLDTRPKPVQRPHPPLFIGGSRKRMLSLAAREADIVGIVPTLVSKVFFEPVTITAGVVAERVAWVRHEAGERFAQLELQAYLIDVIVTDNQQAAAEEWIRRIDTLQMAPSGLTVEDVLRSPHFLIGTIEQMAEKLHANREQYGFSYYTTRSDIPSETLGPVVARLAGQ